MPGSAETFLVLGGTAEANRLVAALRSARPDARIILSLAGHKMDNMTREIASEVADIARQTSWQDLRPFVLAAIGKFAILSALYSLFVFILVNTG